MTKSTKSTIVKANARADATRAFGVVCKAHPDSGVSEIAGEIVVCATCRYTLLRIK